MNEFEDQKAFTVVEDRGSYDVCTPEGRRVITCRDSASASHYALMLNEAYRTGYRQALRDQRDC